MNTSVRPGLFSGLAKCRASAIITARPSALSPAPSNQESTWESITRISLGLVAGNRRHRVLGGQVGLVLGGQRDPRPRTCCVLFRGPVEHVLDERTVAAAEVEAGIAAVAVIVRQLVAGQTHQVEDPDGAVAKQLARMVGDRASLEQHVALRHHELHRDLALDVDVLEHRRARRRRRRPAAPSILPSGIIDGVTGIADVRTTSPLSGPKARVSQQPDFPRQGEPERRVRLLRDRLDLDVGDAGRAPLRRDVLDRLDARRQTRNPSPQLSRSDFVGGPALGREGDDGVEILADARLRRTPARLPRCAA